MNNNPYPLSAGEIVFKASITFIGIGIVVMTLLGILAGYYSTIQEQWEIIDPPTSSLTCWHHRTSHQIVCINNTPSDLEC